MNRRVVLMLVAALALAGAGAGASVLLRGHAVTPTGTVVPSAHGVFRVSYDTSLRPIPINTMHTWTVHIDDADGRPVTDATIQISGDMPGHGHGLPTAPQARALGGGDYLLEGMQFQMSGDWYVDLEIQAAGKIDTLRIDFTIS